MTTKETVAGIVWKACDTFRGSIDSSLYKDYILSMLFVKYLSDFSKEKTKELEKWCRKNYSQFFSLLKKIGNKYIVDLEFKGHIYKRKNKRANNTRKGGK